MSVIKRVSSFSEVCALHQYLAIITSISLVMLLASPRINATNITKGQPVKLYTPLIKPGEYVWQPEVSPTGPVIIIVSLSEQILYVYRNGIRIGRTTISSGKAGHRTPTGVFTILQKSVDHTSTLYKGATMPYMERLTWDGVAIHAGNLPGYPAAHGCVRLPLDFAKHLYSITTDGTTVIVTNSKSASGKTVAAGLLFDAMPSEVVPPGGVVWKPEIEPTGPVSILVSSSDGVVYVYRNGVEIGRAPILGLGSFGGTYVYSALADIDSEGRRNWISSGNNDIPAPKFKDMEKHISMDQQFLASARALIKPGATIIVTDTPVTVSTRSDPGFNIITTSEGP